MTKLAAIDWGTTSFRIYLIDSEGIISDRHSSDEGILAVKENQFAAVLNANLEKIGHKAGWPVICSGMITSKQGWHETEYVGCPAVLKDIAAQVSTLNDSNCGTVHFVPGIQQITPHPDIMRGEETQIIGLDDFSTQVIILPGTHSKWVTLQDGIISGFSTFMTGDIYKALISQTILRAVSKDGWSETNYRIGVRDGVTNAQESNGLLSSLFQTRAKSILGLDTRTGTESYLSGFLVGTEIGEAQRSGFNTTESLLIAGDEQLARYYQIALNELEIRSETAPVDCAARGLFRIAHNIGLI